jgi:hypothetical protein
MCMCAHEASPALRTKQAEKRGIHQSPISEKKLSLEKVCDGFMVCKYHLISLNHLNFIYYHDRWIPLNSTYSFLHSNLLYVRHIDSFLDASFKTQVSLSPIFIQLMLQWKNSYPSGPVIWDIRLLWYGNPKRIKYLKLQSPQNLSVFYQFKKFPFLTKVNLVGGKVHNHGQVISCPRTPQVEF